MGVENCPDLLDSGFGPVTLAQPFVTPAVAAGLVGAFAARGLRFIADSAATVRAIGEAATQADAPGFVATMRTIAARST